MKSLLNELHPSANIVFIGFMGCGKSTLGRKFSKRYGLDFFDCDKKISQMENQSIKEIFATKGEDYFRQKEKEVYEGSKTLRYQVISTGGGMPTHCAMKSLGFVVFLHTDFEIIKKRLQNSSTRPLFDSQAFNLYRKRLYIYKKNAHIIFRPKRSLEKNMRLLFSRILSYKSQFNTKPSNLGNSDTSK